MSEEKKTESKRILRLYPDDFEKERIWADVCDVLEIPFNSDIVEFEFSNVKVLRNGEDNEK